MRYNLQQWARQFGAPPPCVSPSFGRRAGEMTLSCCKGREGVGAARRTLLSCLELLSANKPSISRMWLRLAEEPFSLPLCPTKHIPRYLIANSASALPWLPGGRVFCSWVFCRYRRQWSSDGMGHNPAAEVSCPGRGHFIELTGEPHALT